MVSIPKLCKLNRSYLHFDEDEDDDYDDDDSEDCPHYCHRNDPGLRGTGHSRILVHNKMSIRHICKVMDVYIQGNYFRYIVNNSHTLPRLMPMCYGLIKPTIQLKPFEISDWLRSNKLRIV